MDRGHTGVPLALRSLTQVTLLIRLLALATAAVASVGGELTMASLVGYLILGATSFFGLMNTAVLDLVRRHPIVAMGDALLLAAGVALNGVESPLLLGALTTAFLLGLWLERLSGGIVLVAVLGLYLAGVLLPSDEEHGFVSTVAIPFVYVTLWLLGLTVSRALAAERSAQAALRDAVVTAAATEERTKVARELHDSLAKSLQGLALMATALPSQVRDQPDRALESAATIREMASSAVHQVRDVMTDLRTPTSTEALDAAVTQVALGWAARTGRDPQLALEPVEGVEEATRYELLAVLEECLENVHRHAGPCGVRVALTATDGRVVLAVEDDGAGVDPEALTAAQQAGHHGVLGMQERLSRVGGWCTLESGAGRGTVVTSSVPLLDRVER
ncbi:hypothetical protein H9L10_13450 [Phycicoccus endophyticus]|uniref:Sensor histidine kinase n=1 Tax=Phycicoccus endophyticus TaxID=1690220 RepID=A0A7G9R0T9_9MICO|nr:histidine kinase [Phycicoccus endophyticus]NHI19504.1 hypothetical protein [Phycicoccus endophyticus]QNN49214.1 hypothetical protein H9L10_13450 [Phycicoccus endophyticus]GGL39669.1 hypothetical protein GCM10012283_22750 [Phycicoccus endophyticus]